MTSTFPISRQSQENEQNTESFDAYRLFGVALRDPSGIRA